MPVRYFWGKARNVVIYSILGINDSPHRIALGVAVAFFVAWTPTIGIQMVVAITLASLVGGNRAVTIPIVWLSNPFTAVPLYYFNWCVGHLIHYGTLTFDPSVRATLAKLVAKKGSLTIWLSNFFEPDFWREFGLLMAKLGVDLWIGSIAVGLALAVISYPLCRWGVRAYRRSRHYREREGAPAQANEEVAHAKVAVNEPCETLEAQARG